MEVLRYIVETTGRRADVPAPPSSSSSAAGETRKPEDGDFEVRDGARREATSRGTTTTVRGHLFAPGKRPNRVGYDSGGSGARWSVLDSAGTKDPLLIGRRDLDSDW